MSISVNGTDVKTIYYNGTEVKRVKYGTQNAWAKEYTLNADHLGCVVRTVSTEPSAPVGDVASRKCYHGEVLQPITYSSGYASDQGTLYVPSSFDKKTVSGDTTISSEEVHYELRLSIYSARNNGDGTDFVIRSNDDVIRAETHGPLSHGTMYFQIATCKSTLPSDGSCPLNDTSLATVSSVFQIVGSSAYHQETYKANLYDMYEDQTRPEVRVSLRRGEYLYIYAAAVHRDPTMERLMDWDSICIKGGSTTEASLPYVASNYFDFDVLTETVTGSGGGTDEESTSTR